VLRLSGGFLLIHITVVSRFFVLFFINWHDRDLSNERRAMYDIMLGNLINNFFLN
jgi:hypothetical protein